MSDKDNAQARVRVMLEEARENMRPLVDSMVEAACQTYTAAATLSADPITLENENFWRIAGNLFVMSNAKLIAPCPEVAALVDLSKAIAGCSSHWDWASARAICDRLFDSGDGGEELGCVFRWIVNTDSV